MLDRLKILYQLQLLDDKLDHLEELRGDLPSAVTELEIKMNGIKDEINAKEDERTASLKKRESNDEEVEKMTESLKKFKSQLYAVRNNKEYDALTKEIDHHEAGIEKLKAENDALANRSNTLAQDIEDSTPVLEQLKAELEVKLQELKEIIKANEKEEEALRSEREKLVANVKKPDYSAYMRIRKAKKGKAVVTIKRSACSGCHNIVPAQRQLEIRRNVKLFNCEYCGRLLISSEVADSVN